MSESSSEEEPPVREVDFGPEKKKRKDKKKKKKGKKRLRDKLDELGIDEEAVRQRAEELAEAKKAAREAEKKEKEQEEAEEAIDVPKKSDEPCARFFVGQTKHKEETCYFTHFIPEEGTPAREKLERKVEKSRSKACVKHFYDKCKHGEHCLFSHELTPTPEQLEAEEGKKLEGRVKYRKGKQEKKKRFKSAMQSLLQKEENKKRRLRKEEIKKLPRAERKAFTIEKRKKEFKEQKEKEKEERKRQRELELTEKALTPIEPEKKKARACTLFNQSRCPLTDLSCEFEHRVWTEEERLFAERRARKEQNRRKRKLEQLKAEKEAARAKRRAEKEKLRLKQKKKNERRMQKRKEKAEAAAKAAAEGGVEREAAAEAE